mgnify:CR=1 FL=1
MIFELGYEYYTEHPFDCFVGKFNLEGCLVHDTVDTYHGYLKLLGKKHPLYECKIVDGRYNYKVDAFGMTLTIDAFVDDDLGISGTAMFPGKRSAKVDGGAVRRVRISDGSVEKVGTWKK